MAAAERCCFPRPNFPFIDCDPFSPPRPDPGRVVDTDAPPQRPSHGANFYDSLAGVENNSFTEKTDVESSASDGDHEVKK